VKRLRVGVPAAVAGASPQSGHGRVWAHVLRELAPLVDLRVDGGWRTDAWLVDGHGPSVRTRGPVVAVVHEASWDDAGTRAGVEAGFLDGLRDRTLPWLAKADRVLVPSSWAAHQVSGLGGHPVVVSYGVDSQLFRPGPERTPGEVLFVGTVQPRKNLTAVRDAVAAVGGLILTMVVGPTHDRPDSGALLDAALAPLPGTVVRREVAPTDEALALLMARCAVFCLPSLAEGFGLPALEAMACGAAVVVSDRGALPEVVADGGLVVPLEGTALPDALREVVADPGRAAELGARARSRALELTWERTARGWLEALRSATGN
jgi:glycosyltransferase involved in cell wall biosynthesis